MGRHAALAAAVGALLVPSSSALADGPVATKSGAVVNFLTLGKVKIRKKLAVSFECAVNCSVTSTLTLKGAGFKFTSAQSGNFPFGVPLIHFIQPNGQALKFIKANVGKFRLVSSVSATDSTTGATDSISHAFKLKR
jgi:hypothetical protein